MPLFLLDESPLCPSDATAALIIDERGHYLLQHRDAIEGIFYPDHWSCFGGAVDPGESERQALVRELDEELGLRVKEADLEYFTSFQFDFRFSSRTRVDRDYFVLRIERARLSDLSLGEGQAMGLFDARIALTEERVVPYDAYALWLHLHRERFKPDTAAAREGGGS